MNLRSKNVFFLSMILGTLGASLLGDLITKNLSDRGAVRAQEGTIRADYGFTKNLTPHPLTNFEIQRYYQKNLDSLVFIVEIIYPIK